MTGSSPRTARGRVVRRSDVSSLADAPVTTGVVLLVPEDQRDRIAGPEVDLHRVDVRLEQADVDALGARVGQIDEQGTFAVDAEPGRYALCLADLFVDHRPGPPFDLVGCASVALPVEGLVVGFGEGGVEVLPG